MKQFLLRLLEDLKQGNNIDLIVIILAGILISIFNLVERVSQQIVLSTILATLGLVAIGFLVTRHKIEDLYASIQQSSFFLDREELKKQVSLIDLINQSDDLFLGGVALGRTVRGHRDYLLNRLKMGAKLRFLVLHPHSPDIYPIARSFGMPPEQIRNDIKATLRNLDVLHFQARSTSGKIEVRLLEKEPSFSFIVSNPRNLNSSKRHFNGGIRIIGESSVDRSYFILRPTDRQFDKFVEDCESLWKRSQRWAGNADMFKPIIQKAGVVAYRPKEPSGFEVLLITTLSHPESWIFPMGMVEPEETLVQTALRECLEESGYEIKIEDVESKLGVIELDEGETINQTAFFLATISKDRGPSKEKRQRKWVPTAELLDEISEEFRLIARVALIKLLS